MLADVVDAVVGVDTHRDTHEVEIASPNGVPIARCSITNDSTGYARLLAWIVDHAPGPRLVASIEGSRSYGIGLSRALTAAGLQIVEAEQPNRSARRGKGKSDVSDAHLAVMAALRLDAGRLPAPRVDGDREGLADSARRPPGPDRDRHRADQPAAGPAAQRRERRPRPGPRRAHRRRAD